MRILLASVTCEKDAIDENFATHLEALAEAEAARCDLAVLPEMSLTGSVDALRHPDRAVTVDHERVQDLVTAADRAGVAISFGIAERHADGLSISQVHAVGGEIVGVQRKRHLGEGEDGFLASAVTVSVDLAGVRLGSLICAESHVDVTWDASAATGATVMLFTSAPGLYGRRTDDAGWRAGTGWWTSAGVADARHHAKRLGVWVAMATQAGSTVDEDFPGMAALISPSGEVVDELSDWRPGTLVVDAPVP